MARDAQQRFYYHDKLLFRVLLLATVLFFGMTTVRWWLQNNSAAPTSTALPVVERFSERAAMAAVTSEYAYNARYIHDIEQYPEIQRRFLGNTDFNFKDSVELAEALKVVYTARQRLTESVLAHVYHASYYIGNLLILPNISLHELLLENRPHTTILLESALADIRAGVVTIGLHHDVAPPYFYDHSLSNAVYYPAPSAPSLTVSEAAIVFYVMAALDPNKARVYEQQLSDFANQVLTTGAHFARDIQAGLDLAYVYFTLMRDREEYKTLFTEAAKEWEDISESVVVRSEGIESSLFKIEGFPYATEFFIDQVSNQGYVPQYRQESLTGSILLSLEDTRIDPATQRLYRYEWGKGVVVPTDVALGQRLYPFLRDTREQASYLNEDEYYFVSQDENGGVVLRSTSDGVGLVSGMETSVKIAGFTSRVEVERALYTEVDQFGVGTARFFLLTIDDAKQLHEVAGAMGVAILDSEWFLIVQDGTLYRVSAVTGEREQVIAANDSRYDATTHTRSMKYFPDVNQIAIVDVVVEENNLIPQSVVQLYSLSGDSTAVTATPLYSVTFTDTMVGDFTISPAGRYLALSVTNTLQRREPKVLIFDIMNGIIKKEIDLSPFNPVKTTLDGWTLF